MSDPQVKVYGQKRTLLAYKYSFPAWHFVLSTGRVVWHQVSYCYVEPWLHILLFFLCLFLNNNIQYCKCELKDFLKKTQKPKFCESQSSTESLVQRTAGWLRERKLCKRPHSMERLFRCGGRCLCKFWLPQPTGHQGSIWGPIRRPIGFRLRSIRADYGQPGFGPADIMII